MATHMRRAGWCAIGIAGVPAALLGVLHLVGPIWLGIVFSVAFLLSRWRALDHLVTGLMLILFVATLFWNGDRAMDRRHDHVSWFIAQELLWASIVAMTIAASKLARMAGRKAWAR